MRARGPRRFRMSHHLVVGWFLELLDALRLQAFGTLGNGELHRLALCERSIPIGLDGGVMDEDIITGSALDKPISLRVVEPLHYTLLTFSCHIVSVFLYWLNFHLFGSCNRPKDAKSRKMICFAASAVPGVRSQKLIKYVHYRRLATFLQAQNKKGCNLAGPLAGCVLERAKDPIFPGGEGQVPFSFSGRQGLGDASGRGTGEGW